MKKFASIFAGLALSGFSLLAADKQPAGTLLELHSCELYAGGCTVSSQAPLDGRYMLRAWAFKSGVFAGQELSDLRLAVLQTSFQNLAAQNAPTEHAVVYLPEDATIAQRAALLAWVKSSLPDLSAVSLSTRVVPLQFAQAKDSYKFGAGSFISVRTATLESCETGACGEALWYTPRTPTSLFTVAVDESSRVSEPLLKLKWNDAGQRSVFLGKFGENATARNQFVASADFCGPSGKLF